MQHYYAIAERGSGRTWWISFPGGSAYSAADDAADIVTQAQDALASLCMYPPVTGMPRAIEDGAKPPDAATLAEFEQPTIVVVIPFEAEAEAKAAA
jgi:hypothetical protein